MFIQTNNKQQTHTKLELELESESELDLNILGLLSVLLGSGLHGLSLLLTSATDSLGLLGDTDDEEDQEGNNNNKLFQTNRKETRKIPTKFYKVFITTSI